MTYFEKERLSGVGISRIGRRTGIPGLELTMEAARAAIDAADCGTGFGGGGLLSPVLSACRAVTERHARHVLVYRTVQMLGGTAAAVRACPAARRRPDG